MNSGQRKYAFCAVSLLLAVLIAAEAGAEARGGWLGLRTTDASAYMGLTKSEGLGSQGPMVSGVVAGGPAAKAGLKAGDTILKMDGIPTPETRSLLRAVQSIEPGKTVPVTVVRKGKLLNVSVTMGDAQTSASALKRAAEGGDAVAQSILGATYALGRGVPQSDTEAVKWYRKAAAQGDARGQANLGGMYREGRGVPQNDAEAVKWFRKAAAQGDALGQAGLGLMYESGRGVPQSDTEAVKWYRKAAEQGDALGQLILGSMYGEGRGVPQSDTEAARWYRKAAEQGNAAAQNALRKRGLTWTVRPPEKEGARAASPTPSSPPAGKQRAPAPKIPDDLGDLD